LSRCYLGDWWVLYQIGRNSNTHFFRYLLRHLEKQMFATNGEAGGGRSSKKPAPTGTYKRSPTKGQSMRQLTPGSFQSVLILLTTLSKNIIRWIHRIRKWKWRRGWNWLRFNSWWWTAHNEEKTIQEKNFITIYSLKILISKHCHSFDLKIFFLRGIVRYFHGSFWFLINIPHPIYILVSSPIINILLKSCKCSNK